MRVLDSRGHLDVPDLGRPIYSIGDGMSAARLHISIGKSMSAAQLYTHRHAYGCAGAQRGCVRGEFQTVRSARMSTRMYMHESINTQMQYVADVERLITGGNYIGHSELAHDYIDHTYRARTI